MSLEVKGLYATVDGNGDYLDISGDYKDCKKWLEEDSQAVDITLGFAIYDTETGHLVGESADFYYEYEDAKVDMEKILSK